MTRVKRITALIAGLALFSASTASAAAPVRAPVADVNPWAALALTSGSTSAAAFCASGAAGCVLPQVDAPVAPPQVSQTLPPPLPGAVSGVGVSGLSPLVLVLGALAAAAAAYFVIDQISGKNDNSPA